ncbi:MAG TPA: hypothetical protein VFJ16_30195 [Longimicrobium sp.]|nr:hypothetical protein [Longimicrobium sp.]
MTLASNVRPERTVSALWVIRTADIVACETAAAELRRQLSQHGGSLQLTVLYLGGDTAVVHSFLRRERLASARVERGTERGLRRELADRAANLRTSPPLLVLSAAGVPQRVLFADVRTPEGRRDVDRLSTELNVMLSRTPMSRDVALTYYRGGEP